MPQTTETPAADGAATAAGGDPASAFSSHRGGISPFALVRRALVVPTHAPPRHRMLAWAALKSERGQTVRQTRVLAMQKREDPYDR